jgi:hypothetical protein
MTRKCAFASTQQLLNFCFVVYGSVKKGSLLHLCDCSEDLSLRTCLLFKKLFWWTSFTKTFNTCFIKSWMAHLLEKIQLCTMQTERDTDEMLRSPFILSHPLCILRSTFQFRSPYKHIFSELKKSWSIEALFLHCKKVGSLHYEI